MLYLLFTVLIYGALGIGSSFLFRNLKGTVLQASLSFMGAAGGSLNGLIMLGAFFPWANAKGAIVGTITSYIIMMWIGIGKYSVIGLTDYLPSPVSNCSGPTDNVTIPTQLLSVSMNNTGGNVTEYDNIATSALDSFYSLSYLWYSTFGLLITFIVGLPVSFITGPTKPDDVDPKYMIPVFDRLFWCCLPKKILGVLYCGVNYDSEVPEEENSQLMENATLKKSNGVIKEDISHVNKEDRVMDQNLILYGI